MGCVGGRPPGALPEPALIFGRRRFADTIERQLDLFARESADLLADCEEAERAYDRAERDEAEEAYGDYQDRVEWAAEELARLRDAFAATLDEGAADAYVDAFDRAAAKRFPRLGDAVRRA